jgi:hypothetical protein
VPWTCSSSAILRSMSVLSPWKSHHTWRAQQLSAPPHLACSAAQCTTTPGVLSCSVHHHTSRAQLLSALPLMSGFMLTSARMLVSGFTLFWDCVLCVCVFVCVCTRSSGTVFCVCVCVCVCVCTRSPGTVMVALGAARSRSVCRLADAVSLSLRVCKPLRPLQPHHKKGIHACPHILTVLPSRPPTHPYCPATTPAHTSLLSCLHACPHILTVLPSRLPTHTSGTRRHYPGPFPGRGPVQATQEARRCDVRGDGAREAEVRGPIRFRVKGG